MFSLFSCSLNTPPSHLCTRGQDSTKKVWIYKINRGSKYQFDYHSLAAVLEKILKEIFVDINILIKILTPPYAVFIFKDKSYKKNLKNVCISVWFRSSDKATLNIFKSFHIPMWKCWKSIILVPLPKEVINWTNKNLHLSSFPYINIPFENLISFCNQP